MPELFSFSVAWEEMIELVEFQAKLFGNNKMSRWPRETVEICSSSGVSWKRMVKRRQWTRKKNFSVDFPVIRAVSWCARRKPCKHLSNRKVKQNNARNHRQVIRSECGEPLRIHGGVFDLASWCFACIWDWDLSLVGRRSMMTMQHRSSDLKTSKPVI